jgi:hypothetical protein
VPGDRISSGLTKTPSPTQPRYRFRMPSIFHIMHALSRLNDSCVSDHRLKLSAACATFISHINAVGQERESPSFSSVVDLCLWAALKQRALEAPTKASGSGKQANESRLNLRRIHGWAAEALSARRSHSSAIENTSPAKLSQAVSTPLTQHPRNQYTLICCFLPGSGVPPCHSYQSLRDMSTRLG